MMLVITLTVILIMPPEQNDITQSHVMTSARECTEAALAWIEQDAVKVGAIGLAADCSSTRIPGKDAKR